MSIRAKTRRRLFILLIVTALVVALFGSLYYVKAQGRERDLLAKKPQGIEAARQGRYADAVQLLGTYFNAGNHPEHKQDPDVLLWLSRARLQVPLELNKHLFTAMNLLQQLVAIDPDNQQAQHELLDLFVKLNRNTEALTLADTILAKQPHHPDTLYRKAVALFRLRRDADALAVCRQLVETTPDHFRGQILYLQTLAQNPASTDPMLNHARALVEQYPDDPKFAVILSHALMLARDVDAARQAIAPALAWTPEDPDVVLFYARHLVALGRVRDSVELLQRAADARQDPQLQVELAQRLWETDQFQAVVDRLASVNPDDPKTNPYLLAYKAMALFQLQQIEPAKAIVNALTERTNNPPARAWSLLLSIAMADETVQPSAALETCRQAVELDPANPMAFWMLGQSYAAMGENELAIQQWQAASSRASMWPKPYLELANALLNTDNILDALQAAEAAYQLAPDSTQARLTFAQALAAATERNLIHNDPQALAFVQDIQRVIPLEPRTLPILVYFQLRAGLRDQALATLENALKAPDPLPPATLRRLAALSRTADLGLEDRFDALVQQTASSTPDALIRQALALHRQGQTDQALALFDHTLQNIPDAQAHAFRIARAGFLDIVDPPKALDAWRQLLTDTPKDPQLLQLALRSESLWQDRDLADSAINSLRELTGDRALAWRVARARLLLLDNTDPSTAEAVSLLQQVLQSSPDLADARLLLANAQERLGQPNLAIDQLTAVLAQEPAFAPARFDLARLLISQRQLDRARQELDTLARDANLEPADRRRLAYLYAQADQPDQAVNLLQKLHDDDQLDEIGVLQLAELQRQAGRTDQALALCQPLLDNPSPAVIEFAADLFASLGRLDRAQTLLASLDDADNLPPKRKLAIRAGFAMRHGAIDHALELMTQLADAHPRNPQDWINLVSFAVRAGRIDDALKALDQAVNALPNDASITALASQAPTLRSLGGDNTLTPLLSALIDQPQDRPQIQQALTLLADAQEKNLPADLVTGQLAQLAERYPTLVALQNLVIRRYLAQNNPDQAARLAQRAMDRFPRAVEPAWLAAEAFAAQKKWADALAAAEQWRKRSTNRPLAADVMIAQAQLELDRPEQADAHMRQYLQWALQNPDAYSPVIVNHARALVHQQHPDQAHDLLWPLTEKTPAWRLAWMQLAANELPTEDLARRWLSELPPRIPDDDLDQRLTLGQAWIVAGRRLSSPALKDQGFDLLAALAEQPGITPENLFNIALTCEIEERFDDAGNYYRRALASRKDFDVAMNNLAMLLVNTKADLQEALSLARAAVNARPDVPTFHDTLATVQQALALYDPAADSLRKAIALEPNNLEWQAHLAQVLRQAGKPADADELAAKIRLADPTLNSIPEPLRPAVAP